MYAQLGDIVFDGLFAYHDYEDTGETKYAEVDLIGGKPDLQHTGGELDVITLNIRLHESFCDPELRYNQFRTHRINCDILPFINGYGTVIGNFVIQKVKRNVNHTDTFGRVVLCECELNLKEYVDPNRSVTISNNAKDNAFALTAKSLTLNIVSPPPNANADIFSSLSALSSSSRGTIQSVKAAAADPVNAASYFKNAVAAANDAYNQANDLQRKIETYISQGVGSYTGMVDTITAVKNNITLLKTTISAGDIAASVTNVTTFGSSINQLNTVSLPVKKLLILR